MKMDSTKSPEPSLDPENTLVSAGRRSNSRKWRTDETIGSFDVI